METVNLFLSVAQLRKMSAGKPFQLNHSQLKAAHGKHHVAIHLNKRHYNKLLRNMHGDKGFRFTPEMIQGGSILDKAGKAVSSIKEAVQPGIDEVGDQLGAAASDHVNHLTDIVKKAILSEISKGGELLGGVGQPTVDRRRKRKGGDIDWGKVLDTVKGGLESVAKPYEVAGINPVTAGYDLGNKVIGPALDKAGLLGSGIRHRRKKAIPVEGGAIIGGVPQAYTPQEISSGIQPLEKGGSFISPGGGCGLSVHGKSFKSMKEKMDYLRSLRKKK